MGCNHTKLVTYLDSKYSEEKQIRQWEDSLGFREMKFVEIVKEFNSKLLLDGEKISFSKFENFLLQHFRKGNSREIFRNKFFHMNDKNKVYLDSRCIKYVFLVLCPLNTIECSNITPTPEFNSKGYYIDKAEFIYTTIKDDDLNDESEELDKLSVYALLESLVIISCEILPKCYIESKKQSLSSNEGYLNQLKDFTSDIVTKITDELFQGSPTIGLNELNKKFEEDPFVINILKI
jgi:hypothetical protein